MNTIQKSAASALAALALYALPARAQDTANVAKAEQLFDIMHMQTLYGRMTEQIEASVKDSEAQLFPANDLTPALKQEQAGFQTKVFALLQTQISWNRLEPDIAKLYATAYTADQLDGLIAFYRSPLGQAVLEKTPELLQGSQAVAQKHLAAVLPQLQQMLHDEQTKIQSLTATTPASGANQ